MKTKISNELLQEILTTTEEIRQLQRQIKTNAEGLATKLNKEINELELIQNPSETLQKYIMSSRNLLREIQRIPKSI